jgi:hypothetical protein
LCERERYEEMIVLKKRDEKRRKLSMIVLGERVKKNLDDCNKPD